MIRTDTTILCPNVSEDVNRLRVALAILKGGGFTPCFKTSYFEDGVAHAFSKETNTDGSPSHTIRVHTDGKLEAV